MRLPDGYTVTGGTPLVQRLLFEAAAAFPPGFARVATKAVRRYVFEALHRRVTDPGERKRHWSAFDAWYRANVNEKEAGRELERLRDGNEEWRQLLDEAPATRTVEAPQAPPEPCVPLAEVATRLGLRAGALQARIARGRLRSYRVGQHRLVPLAEVERLAEAA